MLVSLLLRFASEPICGPNRVCDVGSPLTKLGLDASSRGAVVALLAGKKIPTPASYLDQ